MPVSYIVNRIKALVLIVLNLFKRVMCIFHKRRRKPSGDIIMESVVTESSSNKSREKMVPWNTWDENKPATVEDHIEQYRKSLTKLRSASEEIAHEPDFFNDMTPQINTSNALKLNFRPLPSSQQQNVNSIKFDIQENFDSLLLAPPGLGDIIDEDEDTATTGWDAGEDINDVLKQQKIEERRNKRSGDQGMHNNKKN